MSYCSASDGQQTTKKPPATAKTASSGPCITGEPKAGPSIDVEKIPRFGANSPFGDDAQVPEMKKERRLWADSWRWSKEPKVEFHCAVDTQKRMKDKLDVWGIPRIILMEPDGYVVWEGFPQQPDYELTDEIVEKILAVGRKLKGQ